MADKPDTPSLVHPSPGEAILPLPRHLTRRQWGVRFAIWAAVLGGFLLMLHYDVALMLWRYRMIPQEPRGWTRQVLFGLRDFGQIVPIVVGTIIILQMDRRRWFIVLAIILAQALASAGYNIGKYAVARYRPYAAVVHEAAAHPEKAELAGIITTAPAEPPPHASRPVEFEDTWLGLQPAFRDEETRSFPSGHSASAFAFAGVLVWFYPRLRRTFWVLAFGCALSRYLDAVHWPSDCWAGGTIGYVSAWIALRPYFWVLPIIFYRRRVKRRQAAVRKARTGRDDVPASE